ncbi:YfiR family protein [Vibrio olivae]
MFFKTLGLLFWSTLFSYSVSAAYTPEQVKAVYLFRIANFIYWKHEPQMKSVEFCLPDSPEVKKILQSIVTNKTVRHLPLHIADSDCDILFVTKQENLHYVEAAGANTVTIGDLEQFTRYGGVIELYNEDGRIKPKLT